MKDTTLGDVPIEEGTLVWADVWTIQFDKKLWGEDAEDFVPERSAGWGSLRISVQMAT